MLLSVLSELANVLWLGDNKMWLFSAILLLKEEEVLRCSGVVLPLQGESRESKGGRVGREKGRGMLTSYFHLLTVKVQLGLHM